MNKKTIIFTDLDGSLLDIETYSFTPAMDALCLISTLAIPLVLTSSKTRAEIIEIRRALGNLDPFVSENGGAVFIPPSYFPFGYEYTRESEGYHVIELGVPHLSLVKALSEIRLESGAPIRMMSEMTAADVMELTGLGMKETRLAMQREYDEPFLLDDLEALGEVIDGLKRRGLRYTQGGRFHHAHGASDKGRAVEILKELYMNLYNDVTTIAIGDSANDIPMLDKVDFPVQVRKPSGNHEKDTLPNNTLRTEQIGPAGWNEAILKLLGHFPTT